MSQDIVDEVSVLESVNSAVPEDEWPTFSLVDVRITRADTNKLASLFKILEVGPLTVTGVLEPLEEDQLHLVKKSQAFDGSLRIGSCNHYKYGLSADNDNAEEPTPIIWASGQSGWFELRPADDYAAIFQDMTAAVRVLYFLADLFRLQPKTRTWSVDLLVSEFIIRNDDVSIFLTKEDIFYRHRILLISAMLEGKEGLN